MNERAEIIQALLELDCIPAGMEMFPATNEGAWDLIKGVIDDSDYYCLVIGGRYGTLDKDGVGFTEKEYNYAISTGKPLMAFLHKTPSTIPSGKFEASTEGREKLLAFRTKVEQVHHCKYWASPDELGGQVSRGLISLRKTHPSDGWIPGSYAADESILIELANLRVKVAELEAELTKQQSTSEMVSIENLSSGSDKYITRISCVIDDADRGWIDVSVTWDQLLKYVGPSLIAECADEDLIEKITLCFYHATQNLNPNSKVDYSSVVIPHVVADQIKIQLRALGYMAPGTKRRPVSDKKVYWRITPSGEGRLLSVQAIAKPVPSLAPTSTLTSALEK